MKRIYKTSWDLNPLFKSDNDPEIKKKRDDVKKQSHKFINKWSKRKDYLTNPKVLRVALDEYEEWMRLFGTATQEWYYFNLRLALNLNSPNIKAKFNQAQEFGLKILNDIQFFELNIAKIDSSLQGKFLNSKYLSPYKHYLEKLFLQSKYMLSEKEEKIMNLKDSTSYDNWVKMLSGFLAKEERIVLDEKGKKKNKSFSEILSLTNSKDKNIRKISAAAFNDILVKNIDVAENELNSVLQYKKINDELRGYKRPDLARHIGDDIDSSVVDSLTSSVTKRFGLAKRYFKLKAKLFKVTKLKYYERNVEYGTIDKSYSFPKSIQIIQKVLSNLDKEFADVFQGFIENGQIDVYPKKGKRSGAFATYNLKIHPTYILLNYTNKLNDVLTFVHELGHGINFELSKISQNAINFGTPTSTTEVASTFFEDFVLQELLKEANDELRLILSIMKLNSDISSIFRQVAFYNFETDLHDNFRKKGYLSKNEIGNVFIKHMKSYMGDSIEFTSGSENWWIYVGHFRYFFYVYSYSSGLLISKSLQASVKENPNNIEGVKKFLSSGLSDSPKNIFAGLNIDIAKQSFWNKGLNEVETLLKETEQLAVRLNKIK